MASAAAVGFLAGACLCFLLFCVIYAGLWYTNTLCITDSKDPQTWYGMNCASVYTQSPAPAPAPATNNLPSGYTVLQSSELVLDGTNPDTPVANQPTGISSSTTPVQYTISFKMKLSDYSHGFREILQNRPDDSWNFTTNKVKSTADAPLFSVFPDIDANKGKLLFRHLASNADGYLEVATPVGLDTGIWYNVIGVADTTKLTLYINGSKVGEQIAAGSITLKYVDDNNFVWNPNPQYATYSSTAASPGAFNQSSLSPGTSFAPINVKDAYWWPRALSASEVASLIPGSSSTTSTYMPNPCAGITPTSLAKDVSPACLQQTWKAVGCSEKGTVYTGSSGFTVKGWINSSPGGLGTTVYCSGSQVSGDAAGNCGVGNFGAIIDDFQSWATVQDGVHINGCYGSPAPSPS